MGRSVAAILYVVLMAVIIIAMDLLFFRGRSTERLIANVGIVVLFAAFYLIVLRRS